MKKYALLWLPMTLAVVATIAFALKLASLDSASTPGALNADTQDEGVAEIAEKGAAREADEGTTEHDSNRTHVSFLLVEPTNKARRLKDVFDYSLPLVEGFEEIAVEGAWSYDDMMNNVAHFQFVCEAGGHQLSGFLGESLDAQQVRENVARLCNGYDAKRQELEDYLEIEPKERMEGVNRRAALENSLDGLGPDGATIAAVAEISRALDMSDYAGVIGAVWFLGNYYFDGVSAELAVYSHRPNVETMFAVSSSIFCSSIGGCNGSHPVTINLCMMFPWRPCGRRPADIHDAIDQILTGTDLDTFNEMSPALVRLLNRYRAGNL